MRRRGGSAEPDEGTEDSTSGLVGGDDGDEEQEEDERRPVRQPHTRRHHRGRPLPMRPWTISDLDDEDDDLAGADEDGKGEEASEGFFQSLRRPVFFRARDSWYFEPLVALAIIVLLLVSLYAYTSNWPPVYVVESGSMQHGSGDTVGLINAGDLVLIQKVSSAGVVSYAAGERTGYGTYGEYGDVLLYYPNGDTTATPVIHRAILYLNWDASNHTYSAPALAPLPCGSQPGALYAIAGSPSGCGSSGLVTAVTLYHVGWRDLNVTIPLGGLGHYSGFITMGDGNILAGPPAQGEVDQVFGISGLVAPSWIVGEARGMVPWVGSFKLLLEGNAAHVPPGSWQLLAVTISAVILAGFGLHYLFRVEGIEDPRRIAEERRENREDGEEEEDEEGDLEEWSGRPGGGRWRQLREWLAAAPDVDDVDEPLRPRRHLRARPRHSASTTKRGGRGRGRPPPTVRGSHRALRARPRARTHREEESL